MKTRGGIKNRTCINQTVNENRKLETLIIICSGKLTQHEIDLKQDYVQVN